MEELAAVWRGEGCVSSAPFTSCLLLSLFRDATLTSEATEAGFLVVFADVGLVVPPNSRPQVFGSPDWSFPKTSDPELTSLKSLSCRVRDQTFKRSGGGGVIVLPDHARGSIAHGGVLGLDELLVVVDAAVYFVVFFARQLLLRGGGPGYLSPSGPWP